MREGIVDPARSIQIGIRTHAPETCGIEIIDGDEVARLGCASVIERILARVGGGPAYMTFDIDCLDPAFAPGTGTPVAGGLSSREALLILRGLRSLDFVGGDVVEVSVSRAEEGWRVSVTDQGPGVPEAFRERVFSRFAQADGSDSRAKGGTGLGLSIARAIVEAHEGEIGFECPPGGGAVFAFRLPGPSSGPRTESWRAPFVIVFSHDPDRRRLLVGAVAEMGLTPEPADSAEAARRLLEGGAPAAVLMDCGAANEACRQIVEDLRRIDPNAGIPALMLAPSPADAAAAELLAAPLEVLEWPAERIDPQRLRCMLAGRLERGARVLLIEDDDDQARLLTRALEGLAMTARAGSCAAARQMLEATAWDAVILDLRMPDGRGESLIGAIRETPADTPLVLVYSVEEARGALRAEVDGAFLKSVIEPGALAAALSDLLQRRPAGLCGADDPGKELTDAAPGA